jgi:gliding motility-associated-like protein
MRDLRSHISRRVNVLLTALFCSAAAFAQPPNNSCSDPAPLCPDGIVSGSNYGATITLCPDCEDDFSFCFNATNTVWYSFTTNAAGGDVTLDFSNIVFSTELNRSTGLQAVVVKAAIPCNASGYTLVSNCEANGSGNFAVTSPALDPLTTYLVIVNGRLGFPGMLPAEATFDITASGPGITRPVASVDLGGATFACPKQQLTFYANLTNCTDSTDFIWRVNGAIEAVTGDTSWTTSEIEDGDVVTVESTCFSGCPQPVSSQLGPITVEDLQVDAGPDQTIAAGESTVLSGTTNGTGYYWSPGGLVTDPLSLQTIAVPVQTTSFFLTASSTSCTLSDEVIVTVGGQFVIPGSFSPNGDGVNDTWIISGIDTYPNANVQIFTRWGQEILNIVGYSSQKSWDGTNHGSAVTDGVYFYSIDLRDGNDSKPLTGYVTVLR